MKKSLFLLLTLIGFAASAQTKNFLDQPYLETSASADTLVIPDRIYLNIRILESDTKGRVSLEVLEQRMVASLRKCEVDIEKQLSVADLSSDFKKYFLRGQQVMKEKTFELVVYDAEAAGCALYELEQLGISNVYLNRTEYSEMESLQMELKAKAVLKARQQARMMTDALGQGLGKAIYISDSGYSVYPMLRGKAAGMEMAVMDQAESYQGIGAEFQKTKVEVNVQVKFSLAE